MKRRQLTSDEWAILSLLGYGADNARHTIYLAGMTRLSTRVVRKIIQALVIDCGIPIVGERTGSRRGYYIATNEEERARAIAPLNAETKRLARRKTALELAEIRTNWLEYLSKGDQGNG